jgi:hypothetical protein
MPKHIGIISYDICAIQKNRTVVWKPGRIGMDLLGEIQRQ